VLLWEKLVDAGAVHSPLLHLSHQPCDNPIGNGSDSTGIETRVQWCAKLYACVADRLETTSCITKATRVSNTSMAQGMM
jgi:hypothetical protein